MNIAVMISAEGTDIGICVQALAAVLRIGPPALGFEAPMFIPIRADQKRLTAARKGESRMGMPSRPVLSKRRCHRTRDWAGGRVRFFKLATLRPLVPEATVTLDWRSPSVGTRAHRSQTCGTWKHLVLVC